MICESGQVQISKGRTQQRSKQTDKISISSWILVR